MFECLCSSIAGLIMFYEVYCHTKGPEKNTIPVCDIFNDPISFKEIGNFDLASCKNNVIFDLNFSEDIENCTLGEQCGWVGSALPFSHKDHS